MKKSEIIVFVTTSVLQLVGLWFGYSYINQMSNQGDWTFGWILSVIAVTLVSIGIGIPLNLIIHELGHLLGGLLTGWKFVFFSIFKLAFVKRNGNIQVVKCKPNGLNGSVALSPPQLKNDMIPYKGYFFSGALMNILVAGICFPLFFHFASHMTFLARTFLVIGLLSLDGIANLVPILGANATDGYQLLTLGSKQNIEARLNFWRASRLSALTVDGCPPRDIPTSYFQGITSTSRINDMYSFGVALAKYLHLFDKGEEEKALLYLQDLQELVATPYRPQVNIYLLFHELIGECREEEVNRLYTEEIQKIARAYRFDIGVQRVLYAYARLFAKDTQMAKEQLEAFHKARTRYAINFGSIALEEELIVRIDKIADERGVSK